jgi:hypothetical protein
MESPQFPSREPRFDPRMSLDRDGAQGSNKVELCSSEKTFHLKYKSSKSVYSNKYV